MNWGNGYARVYENQGGKWIQLGKEIDGKREDSNFFLISATLSGDGKRAKSSVHTEMLTMTKHGDVPMYTNTTAREGNGFKLAMIFSWIWRLRGKVMNPEKCTFLTTDHSSLLLHLPPEMATRGQGCSCIQGNQ